MPRLVAQVRWHSESIRFRTHKRCRTGASHFLKDAARRPTSTSSVTRHRQVTRHSPPLGRAPAWPMRTANISDPDRGIAVSFQVVPPCDSPLRIAKFTKPVGMAPARHMPTANISDPNRGIAVSFQVVPPCDSPMRIAKFTKPAAPPTTGKFRGRRDSGVDSGTATRPR